MKSPTPSPIAQQVYDLVGRIPKGKVLTYGTIARELCLKTPRQVGWILHHNEDPEHVPCHRVVFASGAVSGNYAFGGPEAQRKWLQSEGVTFRGDKVNMQVSLWRGSSGQARG